VDKRLNDARWASSPKGKASQKARNRTVVRLYFAERDRYLYDALLKLSYDRGCLTSDILREAILPYLIKELPN
jgi:hypothetical protein